MCQDLGVYACATVADHITPHRGDAALFWRGKLQSLCKPHHDRDKQHEERMATPLAVDADGWPVTDPRSEIEDRRRHLANGGH